MIRTPAIFHNSKLFMYVLLSLVMSGYDAVATMEHIRRGIASEGNPLMDSLIQRNAVLFFFVKMAITALGLLICYNYSNRRTARVGIKGIVGIYAIVCLYHTLIVFWG